MDIISTRSFNKEFIGGILKDAKKFEKKGDFSNILKDKILATLFYEPSTRTRFSFQSAMQRLGGRIVGFDSAESASVKKGETLTDTIQMVSGYSDCIVIRHPKEGSAKLAADISPVPVVSAGDGSHDHPTQTLLDLYTIQKSFGGMEGLNVGICGDLRYGRTGRPLSIGLSHYGVNMFFISPPQLSMDKGTIRFLKDKRINVKEMLKIEDAIKELDVLYMTRIQQERFPTEEEYLKFKGVYVVDKQIMDMARPEFILMHPLPRVDEIRTAVDSDPRAKYFEQAKNGVPVRMAVLNKAMKE
ncbi:MAG: aspartate carbamoyltransferase [Candidatus Altiarchaeota archaeon]|nr:aspartate carbamoyltransferase [Candidatus Altiarchaeota archaeon]